MALKATRITGPLSPPSPDYRLRRRAASTFVRLQLRGVLEANFLRARSRNFASVQTS